jgi:hypothetical protein
VRLSAFDIFHLVHIYSTDHSEMSMKALYRLNHGRENHELSLLDHGLNSELFYQFDISNRQGHAASRTWW